MRVVSTAAPRPPLALTAPSAVRVPRIELLGLAGASIVVLLGVWLAGWGALAQAALDAPRAGTVNLRTLQGQEALVPLLDGFEDRREREAVARALFRRTQEEPALEHVGGLAFVTLPRAEVQADARRPRLRARLERRPSADAVEALTSTDLASLKPHLTVRTPGEYAAAIRRTCVLFIAVFWGAFLIRRAWRAQDDPLILPVLMLLTGIGLVAMIALRDPLRDTISATLFVQGVAGGLVLLTAASRIDLEASRLRRAVIAPLAGALTLAALLLVFGSGPGSSAVKVNLFGFQPVEIIRLLVVFALAAHLARRLELIRELEQPPHPARWWTRLLHLPRWIDVRPVVVSMALVLAFFFLQKDLGPALVLTCVFLGLYGVTRGRAGLVMAGLAALVAAFAVAYAIGYPATVRQRVMIWADPWNSGVPGGNQVAHGLWALATGALWGSGPGLGSPRVIPAGHTDFVLAAAGEELGFLGLAAIALLYGILTWRCLRIALRAPGDYTALLATGLTLALIVQAFVIAGGLLGLVPLSGVVTPFLSYGRSSMLANCLALGLVLAIGRRQGPVRAHLRRPVRALGLTFAAVGLALLSRAAWIQVVKADEFATASSLSEQADGGLRFEYNPRLVDAGRLVGRGTIYDRNGLPLATSRPEEMDGLRERYREAGFAIEGDCAAASARCYPLGGAGFSVLGDWTRQSNWGARNSSYFERDLDRVVRGYDDHQQVVAVVHPRTGAQERAIRRDYRELLPLARHRYDRSHPSVQALLARARDLRTTIDARLQGRTAAALRAGIERGGHARGAALVLDAGTGEVLASVSYPWPAVGSDGPVEAAVPIEDARDVYFDRARYGLYPPGSTFKLVVAAAALRANRGQDATFACGRLDDGRVGTKLRGWARPIRDDRLDTRPHGRVDLRRGIVLSCNAYFAQLALALGPAPILEAASALQIDAARPATSDGLRAMLPHAGYGQGEVLVSPLKMARVAAAIAAGGRLTPVRWTEEQAKTVATQRWLSQSDAAVLARYMREVVAGGSGRALASHATPIAGKTGTAEVAGSASHSWFVGFAPAGGPRPIAFAVLVENAGYGGRAAARIAGDIVTAARELGLFSTQEQE